MSKTKIILHKEYSSEDVIDVEQHILDVIDHPDIPKDEHGFHKGSFVVTVEWKPYD